MVLKVHGFLQEETMGFIIGSHTKVALLGTEGQPMFLKKENATCIYAADQHLNLSCSLESNFETLFQNQINKEKL